MSGLDLIKVIPFFAPATQFGGVVSQAARLCALLAHRGHRVRVVTTDNRAPTTIPRGQWVDRDGYQVYYSPTRPWNRIPPYWTPSFGPALDEAMESADLCCLNVGLTLANRIAARIASRHGVPFIYNAEGALCPTRLRIKGWRKRAFLTWIERPLLAQASACHATTTKEAQDLEAQGVPPDRVFQIPNGVQLEGSGDPAKFRKRFGIPTDAPILLFLGRLHAIKGLELLVRAFAEAGLPEARLVVAGHDEDGTGARVRPHIAALGLEDRILFTGHLDGDDRLDSLAAATAFGLASRSEGLPNAALEALAAGLPCVLTRECNLPEVAEADAGYVLPAKVERFAEALRTLLSDPSEQSRMGDNAKRLVAKRFALGSVADQLEEVYSSVASQET